MIIHLLTIIFVVLFWEYRVKLAFLAGNTVVLPISILVVIYFLSVYLFFKLFFLLQKFSRKFMEQRSKEDFAKEKCLKAMLAYIGGDIVYGRQLWEECGAKLKDDKLFELLSLANAQFYPEFSDKISKKMHIEGELIKSFFINPKEVVRKYSQLDLINTLHKFRLPCLFRELIEYHIEKCDVSNANIILKRYWKSGHLKFADWKILRGRIIAIEAMNAKTISEKFSLCKKANRLNHNECVMELVEFYQDNKDIQSARKIIEAAWVIAPSMHLGKIYVDLDDNDIQYTHKFQHARELAKFNENHHITHFLVAAYAVRAGLWAIANECLLKLQNAYPALALMLSARLEYQRFGNTNKVWENIEKAFLLIAEKDGLDLDSVMD